MIKLSTALPSIIVNTTDIRHHRHDAVLDTSTIQCTQFYYFDEGGGDNTTIAATTTNTTKKVNLHDNGVLHSSSSNNLSRHLERNDKRRQTMIRRSSTGLFSSLSLSSSTSSSSSSSSSNSSDDDDEQKKSLLSMAEQNQYPPIKLTQRSVHTSGCLNTDIAEQLRNSLPSRMAVCSEWPLLYSMDQHGSSLQTMYTRLENHIGPCLVIIQTTDEEIFGAYLTEPIHIQSRFYGSGECFLWRLDPSYMHAVDSVVSTQDPLIETYRWTGKNDYLCYSARNYISFGGGDGRVAIWLNEDLLQGHTESCATFDNKPLSSSLDFECLGLEIWGFRF
ncbi:TLD-domain-containing protein [Circinella umbellata]|nr:TLD-domain-containing protein [Circinella umbellata]